MTDSTLEAVLRRDRLIIASALGVIAALAWAYVLWLAADMDMDGMNMSGFRMIPAGVGMMAPAAAPWSAVEFTLVFVMWVVMMVGMMAPSAAPMILLYARVVRQAGAGPEKIADTPRGHGLVRHRLFPGVDRLFSRGNARPMGVGA